MGEEQKVMQLLKDSYNLRRISRDEVWDRTGIYNGLSSGCISMATRIFTSQLIALANAETLNPDIKRINSLIFVGEVLKTPEEHQAGVLTPILSSYWGHDLLNEFLEAKTLEARYAHDCIESKNAWKIAKPKNSNRKTKQTLVLAEHEQDFFESIDNTLNRKNRLGWEGYNIKKNSGHTEMIGEHVAFAELCAIIMDSVYGYGLDLDDVLFEITIHHLTDAFSGEVSALKNHGDTNDKYIPLLQAGIQVKSLFEIKIGYVDFVEGKTRVARFAKSCGNLATDFMAYTFDSEGRAPFDPTFPDYPEARDNELLMKIAAKSNSFKDMFLKYSFEVNNYDKNFEAVTRALL